MKWKFELTPARIYLGLLVVLGVLLGVYSIVVAVDPSTLPAPISEIINYIQYGLNTSSIGLVFVLVRNISGYLHNKLIGSVIEQEVKFEAKLLAATWIKYQAVIMGSTSTVAVILQGTPYQSHAVLIVSAGTLICDIVASSINKILNGVVH